MRGGRRDLPRSDFSLRVDSTEDEWRTVSFKPSHHHKQRDRLSLMKGAMDRMFGLQLVEAGVPEADNVERHPNELRVDRQGRHR